MCLVKAREVFDKTAFPAKVETVANRALKLEELHRHEFFEILYVEEGSLINRFKGTEVEMKAGDVLILKPYVLHQLGVNTTDKTCKAYCCSFLPQVVDHTTPSLEELKNSDSPVKYFLSLLS